MEALKGAVAIVTGGAEGLGYRIVQQLAQEGMRLAIIDIQTDKLLRVTEELRAEGVDVLPIIADLSVAEDTQRAVTQALAHYGTPRVLIHNAALLRERSMQEIDYANWQKEINIILQAAFILSKAVWQPMIDAGGGSIAYVSSGSALKGFVKEVAYTPGKHGQEGLMKVLSMEGEPFNIAVNTLTTDALINTPMSDSHYTADQQAKWIDPVALAPAFAHVAKFNASDGVTGQRLNAYELSQSLTAK